MCARACMDGWMDRCVFACLLVSFFLCVFVSLPCDVLFCFVMFCFAI